MQHFLDLRWGLFMTGTCRCCWFMKYCNYSLCCFRRPYIEEWNNRLPCAGMQMHTYSCCWNCDLKYEELLKIRVKGFRTERNSHNFYTVNMYWTFLNIMYLQMACLLTDTYLSELGCLGFIGVIYTNVSWFVGGCGHKLCVVTEFNSLD